tara:strand:+ start:2538 stop:3164 length:627 start_codon:yes stop_codon:yes gene_type:complete
MTKVNREQFEEHVGHVIEECFDRRPEQPSFFDNVAENLDFGLTGWSSLRSSPMNLELALTNAMDKVWDQIVQDSVDAPEIAYKNYYGRAPIDGVAGPSLQVSVLSSQTSGGWTFHTDVSLIPIKAAITPQVFSTEEVKKKSNQFKDAEIRQLGQFEAIKDKYPDLKLSKEERKARGKVDPVLERLEALEHDLTEVMTALVSKDIMRSY